MLNNIYDLIIIGGGPAGLSAGLHARRAALKTVLIEKGILGGQVAITKGVENYLGIEEISGMDLIDKFARHAQLYGLEFVRKGVTRVEPGIDFHSVFLEDGELLRAHAVILATGCSSRQLGVPGEKEYTGRGVSYCARCDGLFFKGQKVVVVGGGDSATEESIYLAKIAKEVMVVNLDDSLRASKILQEKLLAECNVRVLLNTTVKEILGDGMQVDSVVLKNVATGREWKTSADGVFVFIGRSPSNKLVPAGIRMTSQGYVLAGSEKLETDIPGIYAVGDLRHKFANQISIAVADGCTAALAASQYIETRVLNRACVQEAA